MENHKLQRTNGHRHYASIPRKLQKYFHVAAERRKPEVGRPSCGLHTGDVQPLAEPQRSWWGPPWADEITHREVCCKTQVAMKLLGARLSSILSLGEKGRGVRCLRGARSRSSSNQNTLSMSAENHHCTVAHCGLRRQQGAQFLQWHLVSPLHTCEAGMMRTMLAEPSLLSPPAH